MTLLHKEGNEVYETDGKMCFAIWHKLTDAVTKGYRKMLVRIVDTDVVVVALATLNNIKPDDRWVAFGTGGHFRLQPMK